MPNEAGPARRCPVCRLDHEPLTGGIHARAADRRAIPIEPRDDRPAWLARAAKDLTGGPTK